MKQNSSHARLIQLMQGAQNVKEIIELVEISRDLFQKKLKDIQAELTEQSTGEKRQELEQRAHALYKEYKISLKMIEDYMSHIYKNAITVEEKYV